MKIIVLNDNQRKRIVKFVKPCKKDFYSYQNLDLSTAVCDEKGRYILTRAYYLSSAIRRTEENYDEYKFVLLTKFGVFYVDCKETADKYCITNRPFFPWISNGKLREMIQYYSSGFSERRKLQKQMVHEMNLEEHSFTEWYLERYYWK